MPDPTLNPVDRNSVASWKEAISAGLAFRDETTDCKMWSKNRDMYRGNFDTALFYNIIFGIGSTLRPNIYFRSPYINVAPSFDPSLVWHAKLLESIDNYLVPQMGVKMLAKRAVIDTFACGTGVGKIGYDSEFGFDQVKANAQMDITDTNISKKGRSLDRIEYNAFIQQGMPWISRVLPDLIVLPPGCTEFKNAEWIAHIVYRQLYDVKEDSKYTNTADLKATHQQFLTDMSSSRLFATGPNVKTTDWVEMVEIRDFKRGEIKVLTNGLDGWLRKPQQDVLQITGLPFEDLIWNPDPEWAWGISDVKQMTPQQDEINETRYMMRLHRKLAVLKFLCERDAFTPEEIAKLEKNEFASVIFGKDIGTAIKELTHQIPQDLALWVNILRDDAREVSGMSRMMSGQFQPGGSHRTFGEASMVDAGGGVRLDDKRDAMADFLVNCIKKVNQIIFSIWTKDTVIRMVGQDGAGYWVQYSPAAIKGDYSLKLDVESMTPLTKRAKKQEVLEVMQILSKFPNANMDMLVKLLLKEYDWADAMALFPMQNAAGSPMPLDQFAQQQNAMMANPAQMKAQRATNLPQVRV